VYYGVHITKCDQSVLNQRAAVIIRKDRLYAMFPRYSLSCADNACRGTRYNFTFCYHLSWGTWKHLLCLHNLITKPNFPPNMKLVSSHFKFYFQADPSSTSSSIRIQCTRNNPEFNASNTCPCMVYPSLSDTLFSHFPRLCPLFPFLCVFQDIKNHKHVPGTWGQRVCRARGKLALGPCDPNIKSQRHRFFF
jgi:hypothetical protein